MKKYLTHENIYLFGLLLMAVSLPLSKFLMSIGQMILAINWFAEGRILAKFKQFFTNKAALAAVSFYFLHAVGVLYTEDLGYALDDLRVKLPLLVLPIIISTSSLSRSNFMLILKFFIGANFIGTLCSFLIYFGFTSIEVTDIRNVSHFISHIRFSLMICVSVFALLYFVRNSQRLVAKISSLLLVLWFVGFLAFIESIAGLFILFVTGSALILYYALKKMSRLWKFASFAGVIIAIAAIGFYLKSVYDEYHQIHPSQFEELEYQSAQNSPYFHDMENKEKENGYYVWRYIAWNELEETWNTKSEHKYGGADKRGQEIKYTMIRYLTSKGLRKDKQGVESLQPEDITAIENGHANYKHVSLSNLDIRMNKILWQLDMYANGKDPSGHSVTQRIEYWRIAWSIFKEHPIIGVGTGDIINIYQDKYDKNWSKLNEKFQLKRPHNQFLSIGATLGIIGLIVFIFSLVYPLIKLKKYNSYFYMTFFLIFLISTIPEDTIEIQAGATFFAFFNALFLFGIDTQEETSS